MKKNILFLTILILSLFASNTLVKAEDYGKDDYIYSFWGDAIPSAAGLSHRQTYDEYTLGIDLEKPADLYEYNNLLYIVDAGTHSLTVLNQYFQVQHNLTQFEYASPFNGSGQACVPTPENSVVEKSEDIKTPNPESCYTSTTLYQPSGVSVTEEAIFIADSENGRILKLSHDFKVVNQFGTPDDQVFTREEEPVIYSPQKISVDRTGRIYVVAKNIYEGILELNGDGTFNRYTGVNPITVSFWEVIQRQFASEEQLAQMTLYLPTSFTNMTIDSRGFIYATAAPGENGENSNMIKAINPKGVDVLKTNGYDVPKGDLVYYQFSDGEVVGGPSFLVDISINKNGMYTVLDQRRGRLFTYDDEGRLLYISAEKGRQQGKLSTPVALTYFGDQVVVLDQGTRSIEVYGTTIFGDLVNEAVTLHYEGKFEESAEVWGEVAKLNSNYEIAYVGIGKSLLRQQKYKDAMHNFKLGHDKNYYSKAFEGYRKEVVSANFSWVMTGVALVIGAVIVVYTVGYFKGDKEER